jgi:hypothetical protein
MVNSLMPPAAAAAESRNLLASDEDIHANLILERGRLYLICFLGTLPHFLANALWNLSMFKWITDKAFIEVRLNDWKSLFKNKYHLIFFNKGITVILPQTFE